jgi:hypothetical protein
MKTVNSISGGKTSAYLSNKFPSDYDVFALVTTNDKTIKHPDQKVRQLVSDKIGKEFVGTLEDNIIIKTILDLEQFNGRKITWVSGKTFEDTINSNGLLPSALRRYCTSTMKLEPIFEWWLKEIKEPVKMRLGFRANEVRRKENTLKKVNKNGMLEMKHIVGKKNNRNQWKNTEWQVPEFPLIDVKPTYKDQINEFWKNKPVSFAFMNNCVGCFHKKPPLLNLMAKKYPKKYKWFENKEKNRKHNWDKFRTDGLNYEQIRKYEFSMNLFEDDFNECDSGYCGI